MIERLATGAEMRCTDPGAAVVVLCLNGGIAREAPGTWSAGIEYLVRRLAPVMEGVGWAEVRYRTRSWKRLPLCVDDGHAALDALAATGVREVVLLGYSMGGAVCAAIAGRPVVRRIIGLAPWLPPEHQVAEMRGRRFDVVHGTLDRALPGIPGVSPEHSRAGFERMLRLGASGTYTLIPGAIHALALRAPGGGILPMPRAGAWAVRVRELLAAGHPDEPR